ncbi:MAG TPA: histone deacetylase [Nitrospiria bacterium]
MSRPGVIYHPDYLLHDTGGAHPESPSRLEAILSRLTETGLSKETTEVKPPRPRADIRDWITTIHEPSHLERLESRQPEEGIRMIDADTVMSPGSYPAALLAVEGALTGVDRIMKGDFSRAFCAVRPPGHHAEADRAMGFCLFNNVAVAARYIQKKYSLSRVMIIDWDVHHGNGTQHIFEDDPTVFYFSSHQYPLYPGTGSERERGIGKGEGYTLNVPMPPGRGDDEYLTVFDKTLAPAVEAFRPEFFIISAGFDAHEDDPLANMRVSDAGFAEMTRRVVGWSERFAGGRVLSCLEGGYNLDALGRSVERHIRKLSGKGE